MFHHQLFGMSWKSRNRLIKTLYSSTFSVACIQLEGKYSISPGPVTHSNNPELYPCPWGEVSLDRSSLPWA